MTPIGSPAEWTNLIDSYVPEILALVIETWEAMPSPASNDREDPLSEALCRLLRRSRDRCDLPFRIDSQMAELDPEAGEDQGRMDIVFSPPIPRESIYFCLECKRLNVVDGGRVRGYYSEYVRFGMLRFVRGQYAREVRNGGMVAFVLDGNMVTAVSGVERNIRNAREALGMATAEFHESSSRPQDARLRETRHFRNRAGAEFVIHHLFLPRNEPMSRCDEGEHEA